MLSEIIIGRSKEEILKVIRKTVKILEQVLLCLDHDQPEMGFDLFDENRDKVIEEISNYDGAYEKLYCYSKLGLIDEFSKLIEEDERDNGYDDTDYKNMKDYYYNAAKYDYIDIIQYMFTTWYMEYDVLPTAIQYGNIEIVKYMLSKIGNINDLGITALYSLKVAYDENQIGILKLLMNNDKIHSVIQHSGLLQKYNKAIV